MKKIPIHLQPGLRRYIDNGTPTGGFLRACLENDTATALERAIGFHSINAIPYILGYLSAEAPADCWGSPAAVDAWISKGGEAGRDQAEKEARQ